MKKSCLDKHEEELEKFAQNAMEFNRNTSVSTKDAIKFIKDMHKNTTKYHNKIGIVHYSFECKVIKRNGVVRDE